MDLASFISGGIYGVVLLYWYLHETGRLQQRAKYKWKCQEPGCYFATSSPNSYEGVLKVADIHERQHREQE